VSTKNRGNRGSAVYGNEVRRAKEAPSDKAKIRQD